MTWYGLQDGHHVFVTYKKAAKDKIYEMCERVEQSYIRMEAEKRRERLLARELETVSRFPEH